MPTPISELGEFGLIRHLTQGLAPTSKNTLLGVGDDAAVIRATSRTDLLVTTDMLLEGVHFDLTYMPLAHLGYKAVAVNVSDICAMNGTAEQITIGIGLSAKFAVEQLDELYKGIYAACNEFSVDLVGGDTCASLNGLSISITCLGRVPHAKALLRSGAKPNDLIYVTGNLGAAYMGFILLDRERKLFEKLQQDYYTPDLSEYTYIVERQLIPKPHTELRELLSRLGVTPTAMIDISDGLSSELLHIATASGVGLKVFESKIPIDLQTQRLCEEMHMSPLTAALNGGEDYEILFTVPLAQQALLQNVPGISLIGYVTDQPEARLLETRDGQTFPLTAQGWDAGRLLNSQE